ncbi:MAG TPA: gamma-glutamyltransferase [Marmoricola sp.]|nr:gamma-glutamyltransferase [Marmoricola sp.]
MNLAAPTTRRRRAAAVTALLATGALVLTATPGTAVAEAPVRAPYTERTPVSRGSGGAVTSVDPEATRIGLRVLKRGGNAVDAAVATAAALGVTEPYSAGIGGGGYFVFYNAKNRRVTTIDGRETAPQSMPRTAFDGFTFDEVVTSGRSVGVPGTLATWETALDRWGSRSLRRMLAPAARLARRGFVVDETFQLQTAENQPRFESYTTTPDLFLPGGEPPAVGTRFRNPDLARTYRRLGRFGPEWFYGGALGREITAVVQSPPKSPDATLPVPEGFMRPRDLVEYRTIVRRATRVGYRGYQVHGMPPSSSGGTTVGEALNIMEELEPSGLDELLHSYLEASAVAFADRAAYLGDPAYTPVPVRRLLDQTFAAERACEIDMATTSVPYTPGNVESYDGVCEAPQPATGEQRPETENRETTNLTVADRWGNVVEYTLTIEQTGGAGLLVPNRGFLLNNELTDFSLAWSSTDPNRLEGGKRPRSSMSPTILTRNGRPFLALGSPGGASIITTVLQVILNRVDRELSLPRSVREPRASQRNSTTVSAEQAFIDRYGPLLTPFGHTFTPPGAPGTSAAEIGALTAIEFRGKRRMVAVAEPTRRGGGSALVVHSR